MKSKITNIIGWLSGKTNKNDHIEVERRWLIHPSNFIPFRSMNGGIVDSATIRQAYVIDESGACLRIRSSMKTPEKSSGFITCKGATLDSPYSSEYEMQIPYDLAETLMANQKVMTKVRHRVYHKNYMVEVDSFADDAINTHLGGCMIVEIEFPDIESANKFTAPSFFGKEVTADKKRYSNAAMFKLL